MIDDFEEDLNVRLADAVIDEESFQDRVEKHGDSYFDGCGDSAGDGWGDGMYYGDSFGGGGSYYTDFHAYPSELLRITMDDFIIWNVKEELSCC